MNSKELSAAMTGRKRLKVGGDKLDRLTDLPINIKHQIQEHLSIEEATRMSVLSRPWRHVWASIPKLVFSPQFCQSKPLDSLINIINTILLQHHGAIKTFLLDISSMPSFQHFVIDEWMLLLSRNGLMDLTLQKEYKDVPYTLPSCVYDTKLERLNLSYCIFKPPCSFRGFHKLKMFSLLRVILDLDVAISFLWMPDLVYLKAVMCSGLPHLKICAPKLSQLHVYPGSPKILTWNHFMDCRELMTVVLSSGRTNQDKAMNLTYLLNCWPNVDFLILDNYYLKCFACELERHPRCLNSLRVLSPFNFNFDDEDAIASLLRMLRSSPNLKKLAFVTKLEKKGGIEVNGNHFEGQAYKTQRLDKLQTLTMFRFLGSRNELLFFRFVLAAAPLLLLTVVRFDGSVDEDQYMKISKELMEYPRTSAKLKIICESSN